MSFDNYLFFLGNLPPIYIVLSAIHCLISGVSIPSQWHHITHQDTGSRISVRISVRTSVDLIAIEPVRTPG